jgi:porphobilinogen deaminase
MTSGQEQDSNEAQATYFAAQLELWATRIEEELTNGKVAAATHSRKRFELYEVRRQIDALRRRFPAAFGV